MYHTCLCNHVSYYKVIRVFDYGCFVNPRWVMHLPLCANLRCTISACVTYLVDKSRALIKDAHL
jgi:hypothetical protein